MFVVSRIRTIKPEFQQSESMGRVSRSARLLFIQLWTFADDYGRARAASRMLASALFPYDDDAPNLIEGWLNELEHEKCVIRYVVDNTKYLQIINWNKHQRVDKPTHSRIPEFREEYKNIHEQSEQDLVPSTIGPRTKSSEADASLVNETVDLINTKDLEEKRALRGALQSLGEQWNELAAAYRLPTIEEIKSNSTRERHALARLREAPDCAPILMAHIRGSPYLRGEVNGFRCTFDWIINPSNFQKIMEGNYENRKATSRH